MSSPTVGLRARAATYGGLFVVTLSMLAYEVALTRIFSVTMWYHFAFVAISLALFGMTAGALIVHFFPGWFSADKVKLRMFQFSLLSSVAMAGALVGQLAIPFRMELHAVAIFSVAYTCALVAIPFTLVGVVVCLALTKFPDRTNRLYAADLVGAAFGCLLLFAGFVIFDGLSMVIFVAAIAALGALVFAVDAATRKGVVLAGVTTVLLLALAFGNNVKPFIKIIYEKEGEPASTPIDDEWNAFSRITVDGDPNAVNAPAVPGGLSPAFFEENDLGFMEPRSETSQMGLLIDGTAGTSMFRWDGTPESTEFLRYDVSNLHYYALEDREEFAVADREDFASVVIGVGGGKDVLAALEYGSGDVTGIEINDKIRELVNDEWGHFSAAHLDGGVDADPRVNYETDEARSWLERSDKQYDSIQISLIDSWAATAAGAYSLTENTLYTVEAWDMFLDRLEPETDADGDPVGPAGILSATRFYNHQLDEPLEVIRTAVLAAETLDRRGVENPRDHILIYEGPSGQYGETLASVMVSPEPFDDGTLWDLGEKAGELGYAPVLTPTEADERFEDIALPGGPGDAIGQFSADVSAPTDNRPFFFQMVSFGDVLSGEGFSDDSHIFQGVYSLFFLGLGVLLLAGVCIGGPLIHIGRRTTHKGNLPHYLFFCGIGLGFLLVEISQLMRLSTFLGHPTWALTVVLFTVLLFSGFGSFVVEKLIDLSKPQSLLRPLVALLLVVLIFGQVTPMITDNFSDATTPMRILVSFGILAPLAFAMGMPFAIGMKAAAHQGAPTAFLWGMNGATSVVASVFAMVIAVFWGITLTFIAGFLAYGLAAGSMYVTVKRLRAASLATDVDTAALDDDRDGDSANGDGVEEPADAEVQPAPAT